MIFTLVLPYTVPLLREPPYTLPISPPRTVISIVEVTEVLPEPLLLPPPYKAPTILPPSTLIVVLVVEFPLIPTAP